MSDRCILGADTGGTAVKWVLLDDRGETVAGGEVATDPGDGPGTLARLAGAVQASGRRPAAVGLACAGIVDPARGRLGRSPNLPGWEDSDLGAALRAAFPGLPTALANDVNAALYGEHRAGAGRGCRDLVMLALGTGVGGGVLLDGRLLIGAHCGAAELGHMVLDPAGPVCACGNRGCLEAWAGSRALLARARELAAQGGAFGELVTARGAALETRDLARTAQAGDPTARELLAEAGRRLGQAVANLINCLDPQRVIVGGGVAQAGDLILGPCRAVVPGLVLAEGARTTPIVPAALGPAAAAVGVAWLAREAGPNGR
ncbi:MAG: ROK family protein [Candidatus Krumholzibacteriia bacterium]